MSERYYRKYRNPKEAAGYERSAKDRQNTLLTSLETDFIRATSKSVLGSSSASYLDIATGTGRIMAGVESSSNMNVGLDSSRVMIELAIKNTKHANFVMGDAEDLPFRDGSFDLVTCFRLLINLSSQQRARLLSECKRVLKRNGLLIADAHVNMMSLSGVTGIIRSRLGWKKMKDFRHYNLLTRPQLIREVKSAGLIPFRGLSTCLPTIFKLTRGGNLQLTTLVDSKIGNLAGMFADIIVIAVRKM